jgi:hypothetical protein
MFLGLMSTVPAFAQRLVPSRPFTPGEVIVKFQESSAAGSMAARVASEGLPITATSLSEHARTIGREIGIPLEAERVISNGSVVLTIQAADLIKATIERLKRDPTVASAAVRSAAQGGGEAIEIAFKADTPGSRALAGRRSASDTVVADLASRLSHAVNLPLKADVSTSGRLLVQPDLPEITKAAMGRLAKRPDIEHAQLNYLRQHYTSVPRP